MSLVSSIREYIEVQLSHLFIYAAKSPGEFIFYVLLILSPLFAISAFFSWKLSKAIEKDNKVCEYLDE